jgi:hypothetical protein
MPIDFSAVYRNTLIDPGYYWGRVEAIREDATSEGERLPLLVEIVLGQNQSVHDGTRLAAILHPTPKGMKFVEGFEAAFDVGPTSHQRAVGQWAVVYVYQSLHNGATFSVVRFFQQTAEMEGLRHEMEWRWSQSAEARPKQTSGRVEWDDNPASADQLNALRS